MSAPSKSSLDRLKLKYIAIAAMLCDHIGMFFLSWGLENASASRIALYSLLRVMGRLTAPLMLFFLAEGFVHTSSRKKYGTRLLIFGLISQIPYALSHYNTLLKADFNMILTLFVTFLMLEAAENINNKALNLTAVFALTAATFCFDWGIIGPLMAWLFYIYRDDRKAQVKCYALICAVTVAADTAFMILHHHHWYGELWQAGMFLVIPLLLGYNGEAGSKAPVNKWVFYVFYPLHLMVIWLIKYVF